MDGQLLPQPNLQALNTAIAQVMAELTKFPNIPALAHGDAIIEALNHLGERIGGLEGQMEGLVDQLRASYVILIYF
jgi:hypothetical protein